MPLWRQVLGALKDPQATDREQILAEGAADLARTRSADRAPDADDVIRIAMTEFAVLLDPSTAAAALNKRRRT
ncbi:hypothetical protein ACPXCO_07020 [Streptomyces cyaneofuscatus]|uniref:hypothetical protein n=1 Tax=Streptomyces TaxID=1883 RepID=UPI002242728F|nr:hypothetical protein [Streptomyces sp. VB1]UZI34016.1 hypothetical protein OH133_38495 [Streptomyces sp. VB1]